jgi:cobalt-zinc-cadmium efflux system membrane fusion protein
LFPRDVGKVGPDQIVVVHGADAAARAEGRVIWVAPFGSSENQTLTARVLLDNANRRWAPGLYVTAEVTLNEADVPIAIRNEALQTLEEQTVVFVRDADGFEPRPVQLGRRDADNTEVTSGLAAGDTYVARNSFTLKAELGKGEAEHAH